jgi:hypothetical protein
VMADTPLRDVPGWTDEYVERAEQAWITTAEQVVALDATPGGLRSLAEQLGVSEDEARPIVEAARNALQSAVRAEMEEPVDTSEYGLGVPRRPPDDRGP